MFKFYFLVLFCVLCQKFVHSHINITIPTLLHYRTHNDDNRWYNESHGKQLHWREHILPAKINLNKFLAAVPSFQESLPINSSNELCAKHSHFVLKKANELELWALKMLDSSGKIPSSILKGNVNQMGDFDQCLSIDGQYNLEQSEDENRVNPEEAEIRGKYCLVSIDITLPTSMKNIDTLIHSHYVIRSKLTDPGHRIPKFASMYWALCIPHTCSNNDVKEAVISQLQKLQIAGLKKDVSLEDFMCQTRNEKKYLNFGTILSTLVFAAIIILVALSSCLDRNPWIGKPTITDINNIEKNRNNTIWDVMMDSFSLKKNLRSLCNLNGSADEVTCLHGIRTLNAIALLLSHKCMQLLFYSYVNRTQMAEMISYPYSMLARSAIVYTDSFILISGCLAAQCFLKNFDRQTGRVFKNYLNRFLRLTPNLMAIILFCTFILPVLNSGPLWNVVISRHAELCKRYWWRNLLYIHNYYGFEEMCLTHTHQLGIDMQLYVFSPFLVYLLWRFPKFGVFISTILAAASTYLRYYVTLQHNLSPIIYYGVSVSQLFNTASLSYILPTHRATSYIMGIFLGYYLHYRSSFSVRLSKGQVRIGTFLFSTLGFLAMFGTYWMSSRNYKYSATEAALYMAFSPIIWCSALIWGIVINIHGYTGLIGKFFNWSGFRIFTRIAYAVYLIQFPVYFYNVGTAKSASFFTTQLLFNIEEYTIIFALSIVLTLLFDLPFHNISQGLKREKKFVNIKTENKIL